MAIQSGVNSVGTAASVVNSTDVMPFTLEVKNNDNTDAVYLGGPGVTTATGMVLAKEERVELEMGPTDQLYAVSTKSGHTISWLKITKTR